MKPTPGDIYCVFYPKLQQYVACQITALKEGNLVAVLDLDWSGDALPDEGALAAMQPLVCDFFFWRGRHDHTFLSDSVPSHYTRVGNIPPLVNEEVNSYGGGWNVGSSLYQQRSWDRIDAEKRARFKATSRDRQVTLPAGVLPENTNKIGDTFLQGITDYAELDRLPCLTSLDTTEGNARLAEYVNQHAFIYELHWASSSVTTLDLSDSQLQRLILDPTGLVSLSLSDGLKLLSFTRPPAAELQINSRYLGRDLTIQHRQTLAELQGLDALGGLHLTEVADVDIAIIADRYPTLNTLRLWGKPGMVSNMASLSRLADLQMFTTVDLFGFGPEAFPSPPQLPHLSLLWMNSLPADAASAIKKAWKKAALTGVDLAIKQARKPEWLAENLNNPFRDWDGREHISAANARKAATLYKKMLASLRTIDASSEAASVNTLAEAMVRGYTEAFNAMDRRSNIIETIEREEIGEVLYGLLSLIEQQTAGASEPFDKDRMMDLFDELRDF
ncbi:hypothetical protein WH279_19015 [Erwinia sp. MYb375]|uniref:hypothetical protein n=1 Tax=unclassified Erwinia TaxID=2622719 RepID=UPI0030B69989